MTHPRVPVLQKIIKAKILAYIKKKNLEDPERKKAMAANPAVFEAQIDEMTDLFAELAEPIILEILAHTTSVSGNPPHFHTMF